jgi:hypothetical protein
MDGLVLKTLPAKSEPEPLKVSVYEPSLTALTTVTWARVLETITIDWMVA